MMVVDWAWYFLQFFLISEVTLLAIPNANSVELVVLRCRLVIKAFSVVLVLVRDLEMQVRLMGGDHKSLVPGLRVVQILVWSICLRRIRRGWRR